MRLLIASAVFSALLASACKPNGGNTSQVKDLTNFSLGGDAVKNECVGDQKSGKRLLASRVVVKGPSAEGNAAALKAEVAKALSAVPAEVDAAASALGLAIIVSDTASDTCNAVLGGASRQIKSGKLDACFLFQKPKGEKPAPATLAIYVKSDVSSIRNALVRELGYVTSQFIPDVRLDDAGQLILQQERDANFAKLKATVTASYLADILTFLDPAGLVGAGQYLGKGYVLKLRDNFKAYGQSKNEADLYRGMTFNTTEAGEREQRRAQFEDFVFAEAFDSYYCNAVAPFDAERAKKAFLGRKSVPAAELNEALRNTRGTMSLFFPETHRVFAASIKDALATIGSLPGAIKAKQPKFAGAGSGQAKGQGLALGDLEDWYYGNNVFRRNTVAVQNKVVAAANTVNNEVIQPAAAAVDNNVIQPVKQEVTNVAALVKEVGVTGVADIAKDGFKEGIQKKQEAATKAYNEASTDTKNLTGSETAGTFSGIINGGATLITGYDKAVTDKGADAVGKGIVNPQDVTVSDVKDVAKAGVEVLGALPAGPGKVGKVLTTADKVLGGVVKGADGIEAAKDAANGDYDKLKDLAFDAAKDKLAETKNGGIIKKTEDALKTGEKVVEKAGEVKDALQKAADEKKAGEAPSQSPPQSPSSDEAPTDEAPTDPAPSDPAPSDPAPADPAPADTSEPAPEEPAPSEPAPSEPAPSDIPEE